MSVYNTTDDMTNYRLEQDRSSLMETEFKWRE